MHYALGFPPYRSGGMTQYVVDLMHAQRKMGDDVALIWPGRMPVRSRTPRVLRRTDVDGIASYEVISPLPVPLREGVVDPGRYRTELGDCRPYERVLAEYAPDVVHIHTFMGLHREFMKAARTASIPIVCTSHDYYGICPHVNLFREGTICDGCASAKCIECCSGGLSMWRIRLMQSRPYRIAKDTWLVRRARMRYRQSPKTETTGSLRRRSPSVEDYLLLQEYYSSMFAMVDRFHFNSTLALETFRDHMVFESHEVVPITHGSVRDNRSVRMDDDGVVDLAYVGPFEEYKGFFVLIESLDALWQEGIQDFRLHVYGEPSLARPYFSRHARFRPSERHEALRGVELLVVPSLCPETFGFTLLEALCEGIPVVATSRVGSIEVMGPDQGVVVAPHVQALTASLRELLSDSTQIREMSERIVAEFQPRSIREHALEIRDLYRVAV